MHFIYASYMCNRMVGQWGTGLFPCSGFPANELNRLFTPLHL